MTKLGPYEVKALADGLPSLSLDGTNNATNDRVKESIESAAGTFNHR
jgi:hypothetical protein